MSNKLFKILLLLFFPNFIFAQNNFRWAAIVDSVTQNGFHKIHISSSLAGKCNFDFSDLRILNSKKNEIPYVLKTDNLQTKKTFVEYSIVEKKISPNINTVITLENSTKNTINNINFEIANADVEKKIRILGSNERENWFAVKETFLLTPSNTSNSTTSNQVIYFPLNNYKYLSVEINDSSTAPLNIIKAGHYTFTSETENLLKVEANYLKQSDSIKLKKTFVKITFSDTLLVNYLQFSVEGSSFYKRNAALAIQEEVIFKNKKKLEWQYFNNFNLSSNNLNKIYLGEKKLKDFYLIIDNEDNPPLKINKTDGFMLPKYLIADLSKNESYTLYFGNKNSKIPSYDLKYFENKISADLPILNHSKELLVNKEILKKTTSIFSDKRFIWIAIIVIIILLSYMSYKIIKQIK